MNRALDPGRAEPLEQPPHRRVGPVTAHHIPGRDHPAGVAAERDVVVVLVDRFDGYAAADLHGRQRPGPGFDGRLELDTARLWAQLNFLLPEGGAARHAALDNQQESE